MRVIFFFFFLNNSATCNSIWSPALTTDLALESKSLPTPALESDDMLPVGGAYMVQESDDMSPGGVSYVDLECI